MYSKTTEIISNFLGYDTEELLELPDELAKKLKLAAEEEDFMKVHSLGYLVKEVIE